MPLIRIEFRRGCTPNLCLFFNFFCSNAWKTTSSSNFISELELTEKTSALHSAELKRHKNAHGQWPLLSKKLVIQAI